MSHRRRAALLLGLALALGSIAAADVARREAALREGVGPVVRVLVAAADLEPGTELTPGRLALRSVPARFAPVGALTDPAEVVGSRTASRVARGGDVTTAVLAAAEEEPPGAVGLRPGQRAAQVVASAPLDAVVVGAAVDVLSIGDSPATTRLVLRGAEVLAVAPSEPGARDVAPRVAATLRVTLAQAIALGAAEAGARELRLLPGPSANRPSIP